MLAWLARNLSLRLFSSIERDIEYVKLLPRRFDRSCPALRSCQAHLMNMRGSWGSRLAHSEKLGHLLKQDRHGDRVFEFDLPCLSFPHPFRILYRPDVK